MNSKRSSKIDTARYSWIFVTHIFLLE